MHLPSLCLATLLTLTAAAAPAQERTLRFYGYAYDLKSNSYLYTELHEQKASGDRWLGGSISYFAADGSDLGRKTMDFSQDPYIPVYKLTLNYSGYNEAITAVGSSVEMAKQKDRKARVEKDSVPKVAGMAADSGFHSYLRAHFDELLQGKTVEFRFIVAGNLDTFKFRARKTGETRFEGKPATRILVEANSLLRVVAPKLELIYEPGERKLLEYRGVSNIHNPQTGKPYDVRVAYYSTPPADAPKLPPLK